MKKLEIAFSSILVGIAIGMAVSTQLPQLYEADPLWITQEKQECWDTDGVAYVYYHSDGPYAVGCNYGGEQ